MGKDRFFFYKYQQVVKKGKHVNFNVKQCSIFVSDTCIMVASPDGLISCNCHGNGVLEIKFAMKYWNEDPNL